MENEKRLMTNEDHKTCSIPKLEIGGLVVPGAKFIGHEEPFEPIIAISESIKEALKDIVQVVRCKNCKCAYINSFSAASGVAVCKKWSNETETAIVQQDDFCSYGERRNDG